MVPEAHDTVPARPPLVAVCGLLNSASGGPVSDLSRRDAKLLRLVVASEAEASLRTPFHDSASPLHEWSSIYTTRSLVDALCSPRRRKAVRVPTDGPGQAPR